MHENDVDVCTKTKLMYAWKQNRCMHEHENEVYWAEAVWCEVYSTCVSSRALWVYYFYPLPITIRSPHSIYFFMMGERVLNREGGPAKIFFGNQKFTKKVITFSWNLNVSFAFYRDGSCIFHGRVEMGLVGQHCMGRKFNLPHCWPQSFLSKGD